MPREGPPQDRPAPRRVPPFPTKSAWVSSELRQMILKGELKPGDRLPEQEVARWFQCSPTPVREAIRQLGFEGLVELVPHRQPQVVDFSLSEPAEVYVIQTQLQRLAIVLSGPSGLAERISHAERINAEFGERVKVRDLKALRTLNYEFHFSLFDSVRLSWLTRIIAGLWSRLPDVLSTIPDRAEQSYREHDEILAALRTGDVVYGGRLMARHLFSSAVSLDGAEKLRKYWDEDV